MRHDDKQIYVGIPCRLASRVRTKEYDSRGSKLPRDRIAIGLDFSHCNHEAFYPFGCLFRFDDRLTLFPLTGSIPTT